MQEQHASYLKRWQLRWPSRAYIEYLGHMTLEILTIVVAVDLNLSG